MAFVDEMTVHIKAGHGGNGVVRWRHERGKEFAGPGGGNGGKGGDVYAVASRDLGLLSQYRNTKEFLAKSGGSGEQNTRQGKNGEDLFIEFPVGSIITNLETGWKVELTEVGQKSLLLSGGRGGLGNEFFKSSRNTTPRESTKGEKGEKADFNMELQLIADFGLIGMPNAGKSSLLNTLTNAKAKIGNYAFTTLEPNLGEFNGYIIADIPGLIEGASLGKGLGHKFLRHIKRTKIIIHCVSLENSDIIKTYKTVREELKNYSEELLNKREIIILTKSDLVSEDILKIKIKEVKMFSPHVFSVNVFDNRLIKELMGGLAQLVTSV